MIIKPDFGIKLAVIGSRTFTDKDRLFKLLDKNYDHIGMIISGGAVASDSFGAEWAKLRGKPCLIFYPAWRDFGGNFVKSAGMARNIKIVENCDQLLICWDGVSRGTKNSIEIAERIGKKYTILKF